jgi:hypothetical protein
MRTSPTARAFLLSFPLLSLPALAQVARGDIAVTGFSTTSFGVVGAGNAVTGYTTTGFLGTGTATSQAILWDPSSPNDFIVGGFGFVGRASITGPGTVTYALITNNVGTVAQMSWDEGGQIIVADSGTDQVRRLDPVTGAIVDLSAGPQPWGTSLNSGARDPMTGDVVVGGSGEIYRLPAGATTATTIVPGLSGVVSAIAFDPLTGEIAATVLSVNRVIRIGSAGTVTDIAPPFSVPGPNALDVDANGDFVTGGGTGQVYRIARAGGAPVFLANNTSPANAVNGLAVAQGGGYAIPFGQGCNGVGGPVELTATGPFTVGATVVTTSTNHSANSLGVLVVGLSRTSYLGSPLPFLLDPVLGTSGCQLYVSIDATIVGFATVPPNGLAFAFSLTPAFAGQRFYVQHACFEPVPGGLSWSNGLALRVP